MPSSSPPITPRERDYPQLLEATRRLLAVLASEGDEKAALAASFEAVARGFGAQKALLLRVETASPLRLQALHSLGSLSPAQISACERGESVAGVSSSVIHRVVSTGAPEVISDPRLLADPSRTPALEASPYSVLAAPIFDPLRSSVLAVLYFQHGGLSESYGPDDLAWLASYAEVAGQVFAYHFRTKSHRDKLEQRLARQVQPEDAPEILGDSAHTQVLRRSLHEVFIPALEVERPEPILILGERGTGKDLVARYLHAYSRRQRRPFVVANCAEITDELAASRFFGHKRGAFTGALLDEPGFFRAAEGGVLFLDEIGELSPRGQAHLLRVLENHTVTPVGQTREVAVDVAVVLATNRDLEQAAREGALRADFYDRFRTLTVHLAPLRDRPWDIPLLLEHFRRHHEAKHRKRTLGFSPEALRALVSFAWPGNVRELARACALFVIHAEPGSRIDVPLLERCLPEILAAPPNSKAAPLLWDGLSLRDAVREVERELVLARLERYGGNIKAAQESLGLTRTTFHRLRKALGLEGAEG